MLLTKINIWTLQYLVGALISLAVVWFVFAKVRRTSFTRIFSLYGILVVLWNILVFFHRNASSRALSHLFYRFSLTISTFIAALIMLLLAYIYKEKVQYWLVLLMPGFVGSIILWKAPFKIVSTPYGWSYEFIPPFGFLFFLSLFLIVIGSIVIGLYILRKVNIKLEVLRIKLIIIAAGVIYLGGMGFSNIVLMKKAQAPSFGGILTTGEFLLIAYAISLPSMRVYTKTEKGPKDILALYVDFFEDYQKYLPDDRFGKREMSLKESLKAMGLDHLIGWDDEGKIRVDIEEMEPSDIRELAETTLKGLKHLRPESVPVESFSDILNLTYRKTKSRNEEEAERWRKDILQNHGPFLNDKGLLRHLDFLDNIPPLLEEIRGQRLVLKPKEKPLDLYQNLNTLHELGYDVKCLTKYPTSKIIDRAKGEITDILEIWEYIDVEEKNSPKDLILDEIEKSWNVKENTVIIIDCMDALMASLGEESSIELVKSILGEGEGFYIIAYNKEILKEKEMMIREIQSW